MSPGVVLQLLGWLRLGKCQERFQTKANPEILSFSSSVTFAVRDVKMRGQPGFGVTLSPPGSGGEASVPHGVGSCITLLTDIFQFKEKIEGV